MGNILPWGVHIQYADAVRRNNLRRQKGFEDFENNVKFEKLLNDEKIKVDKSDVESLKTALEKITSYNLVELRDRLQSGELNAYTTLCAYTYKALEVNRRINCCTEVVKEAFDYAIEIDKKYENSNEKPALYGLPFSVKSNFYMKNYDCSIGVAKLLDQPKDEDCPFVTHLMNLGAVPFVLTNVPQGLLSFVCSNTVYGTTLNPHDVTRTPGGSSGGEGAIISAGGASFGTGSDLAGSLRIPASMCGLVTLKPTQDRFVVTHTHGGVPGRGRLGLSFGVFTKNVKEQILLLEQVIGTEEYRQLVPQNPSDPLNFAKVEKMKSLKVGYFDDDGFCTPVPSHRRAVLDTVEKLKSLGHEAVRFDVPRVMDAAYLLFKNVMPDSGAYMRTIYENENIDVNMKQFVTLLKVPRVLRWIAAKILSGISPQMALICSAYVKDIEDIRYTQELTDLYRLEFLKYWKSLGIDVLICPAFIVPAIAHQYPSKLSTAAFSTGLFNMIDFPAGVVPTGHVTTEDDNNLHDDKLFNVGYNPILKIQREAAANSVGLPNSVQIVTLPFEEELCLHTMQIENMDLLVFDEKKNYRKNQAEIRNIMTKDEFVEMIGYQSFDAVLIGGLIQINDEQISEILYEMAGFGLYLEDIREETKKISENCFFETEDDNDLWAAMQPKTNILVLSAEEAAFLAFDWKVLNIRKLGKCIEKEKLWIKLGEIYGNMQEFSKSFCVFRYLRKNGWKVRSGLTFGCDFLIYCLGPQFFHSSAGVLICDEVEPIKLLSMTRILSHNKKALILASCEITENSNYEVVSTIEVKIVTFKTHYFDRYVPEIAQKSNDLYEIEIGAI
ncbi:unnamed protein product [Caenorhabditis angaria]|uniref:tRNA-intron lyase n=1 Tax=Caenorhabditis angaria TaxID=860376 RepID=A0A9P1N3B9_9PELO|nr:unnamed protein product [Caenorhabditis angaria]